MSGRGIEIDRRDDAVVVRLEGDIDLANTPTLSATILESVPNDALGLVIDLSDVRYIDSVGIRMLFTFAAISPRLPAGNRDRGPAGFTGAEAAEDHPSRRGGGVPRRGR